MEAKRLGLLRELVPKVDLIAVLLNPNNPFFDDQSRDLNDASRALGLKIRIAGASNEREIASAFATFKREQAGALLVGADPYFSSQRQLVIVPAAQLQLPAIYQWREFAEAGGLPSCVSGNRYGEALSGGTSSAGGDFGGGNRGTVSDSRQLSYGFDVKGLREEIDHRQAIEAIVGRQ